MNYRILLLFSSLLILLTACPDKKKDPEPEPAKDTVIPVNHCGKTEFYTIDQSLKDQFLFKEGSYWVYADSVTNVTDSIYCYGPITKNGSYVERMPGYPDCTYRLTYVNDSINQAFPSRYNYYIWDNSVYVCAPYSFPSVRLFYNSGGKLMGHATAAQFYPTITIQSQVYTNVYKFYFGSGYWEYKSGYYYMKPGVGIVKIELIANTNKSERSVYELVRHKIIP